MACRECGPWGGPWRGSKCGYCRGGPGLQRNQRASGGAWWGNLARSYRNRPVFGRFMVFIRQRVESFVQRPNVKNLAAVNQFRRPNPAVLSHFIELGRRDSKV